MSDQIVGSLIGAAATLVAAIVAVLVTERLRDRVSSSYRRRLSLPSPIGLWKCDWFIGDSQLYVSDEVRIEKWVRDARFRGKGIQPALTYSIDGEVDGTRVMALTYRTLDFPTKAYVGVACLVFSMDGDSLSGYWYGRARDGEFTGGRTEWRRKSAV